MSEIATVSSVELECGIVMPISACEDCDTAHWIHVREIIERAIRQSGFTPNLVSEGPGGAVLHGRIVRNLHDNPIVVCDVSCRNPNVMLELGLRLAFNKPVIVIKDDKTDFAFDAAPIEHLLYQRDLLFNKIEVFIIALARKIREVHESAKDPGGKYRTFLDHFGNLSAATTNTQKISGDTQLILERFDEVVSLLARRSQHPSITGSRNRWANTSYNSTIIRIDGKHWIERDNDTNETRFRLVEIATDPSFIELHNSVKDEIWRLSASRMVLRKGVETTWLANGYWLFD